ncbi:hypothetical protein PC9H_007531 [Pleurotus ostreatus]|uniref:F-box domain-containing protein n=1 Tax=Pleurotus ostreatus TaxID=5322 RepID=A0A8H6ZRG6_PLEOS|nr:uncharacterized protein PC9H_007531 [Pleurotus ostreatus]KAF7428310.1 hypothetical protein PC9H_007531 [Pleurotus ostreatus]
MQVANPAPHLYDPSDPVSANCSPISLIPDEILSHIFVVGQIPVHPTLPFDTAAVVSPQFEVLVSHVDQHWRHVALSTRSLWRRIDIIPRKTITELQTYHDRSKTCPTDIRLDHWSWKDLVPQVLIDLVMHNDRGWRQAVINISTAKHYHPFLKHLENFPIPNGPIEHLSLCVDQAESCRSHPKMQPDFIQIMKSGAPQLKFVRLRGMAPYYFRPPLTAVTTLHLELTKAITMAYPLMKSILTASPSLTNLSLYGEPIHFMTWPTQSPQTSQGMNLPQLRSLRLWGTEGWIFNVVLSHISAPRVHSLYLKEAREADLAAFWPSSHQSFPILRKLVFHECDFTEASYHTVCEAFPDITDFTVYSTSFNTPIIVELLGNPQSTPIWPNLKTLHLILNASDEQELLYDMVVARADMNLPLSKLRIGTRLPSGVLETLERQKYVEVETFAVLDQWPEGLVHLDDDDVIF